MIISTTITNSREDVIEKALLSIRDEVDYCLVIDTGVADKTMSIARHTLGWDMLSAHFEWCNDFAAARNYALGWARRYAQQYGGSGPHWAVTADTDEVLHIPAAKRILARCPYDVLMVPHSSGSYSQPRCIRLDVPDLKWYDPVHEFLGGMKVSSPAPSDWNFECQNRPNEDSTAKYEGYLEIQRKLEPNQRRLYYLADTLAILNRIPEAIETFLRAARMPGWNEQGAWASMRAAILQHGCGDLQAALESCMGGVILAPHVGELYVLAGSIYMSTGNYRTAQALGMAAVRVKDEPREGFSWPELRRLGADRLLERATASVNASSQIQ